MKFSIFLLVFMFMLLSLNCFSQELKTEEKDGKIAFFIAEKQVLGFNYDEAIKQYRGFYAVRQGSKWGLVSPRGEEVVTCKYDALTESWGEGGVVSLEGKYGVIDTLGNIIIDIDYEDIDHVKSKGAIVKKNGKWAFLNEDGILDYSKDKVVFAIPDRLPLFKFCKEYKKDYTKLKECADINLLKYIYQNITYPKKARLNGTQGMAVVSFVVTAKGNLTDLKILRDPGDGCGKSALRVIELMKKKWIPAEQDGKKVACRYNLPVRFKLTE